MLITFLVKCLAKIADGPFILVSALTLAFAGPASANFIIDPNPGGDAMNLNNAKDSASSTGDVNGHSIGIRVTGNADFASGNASITPAKNEELTTLIFTPVDGSIFAGFSFRGQLLAGRCPLLS